MVALSFFVWAGANQKAPEQTTQQVEQAVPPPTQPVVQNVPTAATTEVAALRLSSIFADLAKHKDHSITIAGQFGGWSHACPSSHMVTRSDWVLFDGTACLFVSGGKPAGVDLLHPKNENVTVTATVKQTTDGMFYLEATKAEK